MGLQLMGNTSALHTPKSGAGHLLLATCSHNSGNAFKSRDQLHAFNAVQMWFHIFSTWPFSLRHHASKGQVTAIQKSLVGWPGFPFRFDMFWEWGCTVWGGKLPSNGSSRNQCYHWQYLSFLLVPLLPAPLSVVSHLQLCKV